LTSNFTCVIFLFSTEKQGGLDKSSPYDKKAEKIQDKEKWGF